jgi:hypothetical protein
VEFSGGNWQSRQYRLQVEGKQGLKEIDIPDNYLACVLPAM